MARRILHVLSQRPSLTGSGVTLEVLVRHAAAQGWAQRAVVGVPSTDPIPSVGDLPDEHIFPLRFETDALPFPVPGMSDVMPYKSTVFSTMDTAMLATYQQAWMAHIKTVVHDFQPDLIHCHHLWILGSMIKDCAPNVPVVNHCHATGLRQMRLCPELAGDVQKGCARNDSIVVLHQGHAQDVARLLGVAPGSIEAVGAGYRDDLFHTRGRPPESGPTLVYAGKYSHAKGLPELLDAVDRLKDEHAGLRLHVGGGGDSAEANALRDRMAAMAPTVVMHGQLDQSALAALMRDSAVFVLPSFYEGLPLVLVEALACGCRLVCTDLEGVRREIAPYLGAALTLVPMPRLRTVDQPEADDIPAFVDALTTSIARALGQFSLGDPSQTMPEALEHFRWSAVCERIEAVWTRLLQTSA